MKIPDSFVPCRREMNWFLSDKDREEEVIEPDIANHPDKYVQAEINYESDRVALQVQFYSVNFNVTYKSEGFLGNILL